jgi:hypothetical protein
MATAKASRITRLSRYWDGPLAQIPNKYTDVYEISVYRNYNVSGTKEFFPYTWVDGDSLGNLAYTYLGESKYWWKIADINPAITDPFSIEPGTVIRIPYGN